MNISGTINKLTKNADVLSAVGLWLARGAEGAYLEDMASYAMSVPKEVMNSFSNLYTLQYKLIGSPHAYSTVFKLSAAVTLLDKVAPGIIPGKYAKLAEKLAVGSGIAAIISPGSGPGPQQKTGVYNYNY